MNQELVLLGKRIAYLRNKKGLTQEMLGELTNHSTNHISKLELAKTNPSFPLLLQIASALEIPLKELFNFDEYQDVDFMKAELKKLINSPDVNKIKLIYKIYSSLDN